MKSILKRYRRTIGIFLIWLLLLAVNFGPQGEEVNAENILICLVFFVVLELLFGYRADRASQKAEDKKLLQERQKRMELGEDTWQAQTSCQKQKERGKKRKLIKAFLLDLVAGITYMALARVFYGAGKTWIRQAVPGLFWFIASFYVIAMWIVSFSSRKREGKIHALELIIIIPFFLHPFLPLLLSLNRLLPSLYIGFTVGWCFSAMGVGYILQVKRRQKSCTVLVTAKVTGNVKSYIHSTRNKPGSIPIPSYQPVLEYFAGGELMQVTCDDGQANPLPVGVSRTIYYNPKKPGEFRFSSEQTPLTEKIIGPIFLGIGFVILIVMAVIWKIYADPLLLMTAICVS